MNYKSRFLLGRYTKINKVLKEVILEMRQYYLEGYPSVSFEEFLMLIKSFYRDDPAFKDEYFNLPPNASNTDYYNAYNIKEKIDSSGLLAVEKAMLFRHARKVCVRVQNSKLNQERRQHNE